MTAAAELASGGSTKARLSPFADSRRRLFPSDSGARFFVAALVLRLRNDRKPQTDLLLPPLSAPPDCALASLDDAAAAARASSYSLMLPLRVHVFVYASPFSG